MANTPTKSYITNIANELTSSLGNGVHLYVSDVVYIMENKFPDLSLAKYEAMVALCVEVVNEIKLGALNTLWS